MDAWEDDLLALAEEPVKPKKKKSKKRKREEKEDSASDMELSAGSDAEVKGEDDADGKTKDSYDDHSNGQSGMEPANMYPLEGLYKDSKDKERIMNMTELERESILDERRTQMEQYHNRQLLKAMVANTGGAEESDEEADKPTRRATRSSKSKQLDELKRRRKAKTEKTQKAAKGDDGWGDSDVENKGHRSSSDAASGEEDAEYDSDNRKTGSKKDKDKEVVVPATKDELHRIVLPRRKLAYYWPTPMFAEYVTGAYVRIGVGMANNERTYRLAQIAGVSENKSSKPYQLEQHYTDTKLVLAIAATKKDFTMENISNGEVTDREYARLIAELQHAKVKPPTAKVVENKRKVLDKYRDYGWTDADLNVVLQKKRLLPTSFDIHSRHNLTAERDIAVRAGNAEEVNRLDNLIGTLGGDMPLARSDPLPPKTDLAGSSVGKGNGTLEDRRRMLASGMALTNPKAMSGKLTSGSSKPGSGATTPQRGQTSNGAGAKALATTSPSQAQQQGQTRFQEMLAAKVDIDLGEF